MEQYLKKYLERTQKKVETIEPDDEGVRYLEMAVYLKSKEESVNFIVDSNFSFQINEGALVIQVFYEKTPYEYFLAIDDISYITDEV